MGEEFEKKKPKSKLWLIIVLVIIILVLTGLIVWMMVKNKKSTASNQSSATATATVTTTAIKTATKTATKTAVKTATATVAAVSGEGPDETAANEVKITANHFMQARYDRSLDEAKPYVTDAFLAKYNPEGFAGTSSPGVGSFEIGAVSSTGSDKYDASVTVHWILGGEPSGDTTWTLHIVKQNGKYLVDDYIAPM